MTRQAQNIKNDKRCKKYIPMKSSGQLYVDIGFNDNGNIYNGKLMAV